MRESAFHSGPRRSGFTLIELLVSMTVLSVLVLLISQLFSSATNVTVSSRKRLDADSQARVVFDHMALDIGKMLKRTDVDYLFGKATDTSGTLGKNDAMFFYSEAPAFYDDTSTSPVPRSSVALVGYRINKAYQLERLGKQLSWDGTFSSPAPGGIMYLCPLPTPTTSATPDLNRLDPLTTLPGNWPLVLPSSSASPAYTDGTDDSDYQILAEQVCRLEICFQLRDGTYSPIPVCPILANNLPPLPGNGGTQKSINYATTGPTITADSSAKYVVGSRWYDTDANRPFVCTDNTQNAAVWKPLGVQDVRAIVVGLAILDATSSRTVPTMPVTIDSRNFRVPKLDTLVGVLADANPADVISGSASTEIYVPSFPTPSANTPAPGSTPNSARLMAEAWNNEITVPTRNFAQSSGLPAAVASQVRIYQRSFVLNNQ